MRTEHRVNWVWSGHVYNDVMGRDMTTGRVELKAGIVQSSCTTSSEKTTEFCSSSHFQKRFRYVYQANKYFCHSLFH